jgi:hypothetical protein
MYKNMVWLGRESRSWCPIVEGLAPSIIRENDFDEGGRSVVSLNPKLFDFI